MKTFRAQIVLVALCAAWALWVEVSPRVEHAAPVLVACAPDAIESVEIVEGRRTVRAQLRGAAAPWLELEVRTAGGGPTDVMGLRGGDDARAAIAALGTLRSLRSLEMSAEDRHAAGLDTAGLLTVRCGGSFTFALGAALGPGQRRVVAEDGSAHLVDGRAISDLVSAEIRLQDREVLGISIADVDTITLTVDDRTETLQRVWSDADRSPVFTRDGAAAEDATRFAARLERLTAHGWLVAGDPDPEGFVPLFAVELSARAGARAVVSIGCTSGPRPSCLATGGAAAPDRAYVVPSLARELSELAARLVPVSIDPVP